MIFDKAFLEVLLNLNFRIFGKWKRTERQANGESPARFKFQKYEKEIPQNKAERSSFITVVKDLT